MGISDWSSDVCSSDLKLAIEIEAAGLDEIAYSDGSRCGFPGQESGVQAAATRHNSPIERDLRACRDADLVTYLKLRDRDGSAAGGGPRSGGRRVGKECVGTCRSRWWPEY